MIILALKFFILALFAIFFNIYGTILVLLFPFNPRICQHLGSLVGNIGSRVMGIEVEVRGHKNYFEHHPCVYVSNHQTNYDMFIIGRRQPYRGVSIGKKSLAYMPFFGHIYWLAGNILINRSNKSSAWQTMKDAGKIMIERNASLYVMPEGTRSKGKGLAKFKKGAFSIAISTQTPIIPIVISHYSHFDFKKLKPGKVIMEAFDPISTTGLGPDDLAKLTNDTEQFFREKLDQYDKELS